MKSEIPLLSQFTALLCMDSGELQDIATSQLTPIGFEVHTVANGDDAVNNIYSYSYNVIVLSENFEGADIQTNHVLSELARMPLNARRSLYVILVGASFDTLSEMQAFALSVDLVIKPSDVSNLKALVGQGLARNEALYGAFRAVAKRMLEESKD